MSVNISQALERLLFEQETVILPGFGGFTTSKTSASVDYAQGSLTPPSRAIVFNENLTVNDGLLVQRISRDWGMTADQALEEVNQFVEQTRTALDQREIITLPGVGRLYKNYAQKVQFLPDNTNFNTDSFGLPPLQFSPIMRSREAKAEAAVAASAGMDSNLNIPQPSANGNGQTVSSPPADAYEAMAEPILPTAPPVSSPQNAAVAPPVLPTEPRFSLKNALPWLVGLLVLALAVGFYFFQKSRAKTTGPLVLGTQTEQTQSASPDISDLNDAAPTVEKPTETKPAIKNEDETPDSKTSDDDNDEVTEAKTKSNAARNGQTSVAEPPKTTTAPSTDARRAVIIVGVYTDKKNAESMILKLKKNGWDTYFRHEDGWQVGIETMYKDLSELKTHLKNLESQTGETDIWIKKK